MLGDAGSNLLGFILGASLARSLSTWALVAALAVLMAAHAASETVTLSRVIERVTPLRWFDRLGRIPGSACARVESRGA